MSENDREYFRSRAAAERALAGRASSPGAIAAHLELATRYDALAEGPADVKLRLV